MNQKFTFEEQRQRHSTLLCSEHLRMNSRLLFRRREGCHWTVWTDGRIGISAPQKRKCKQATGMWEDAHRWTGKYRLKQWETFFPKHNISICICCHICVFWRLTASSQPGTFYVTGGSVTWEEDNITTCILMHKSRCAGKESQNPTSGTQLTCSKSISVNQGSVFHRIFLRLLSCSDVGE